MVSQPPKKLTNVYYWLRTIVPYIVFLLLVVTSCGLPGLDTPDQKNSVPAPTPIVANYTPSRILQYCADTFPLVPDSLFKSGAALVADALGSPSSVNVNEGKIEVFISYITSHSYLKDAFSFAVPAIPADQPSPSLTPTPNPAKFQNSYGLANAVATVQAGNDTILSGWYSQLNANHAALVAARAKVKQYTNRLRNLPNLNDPTGEDIAGCLLSASSRMAGFVGRKTIILSSPLAEDASTLPSIDLSGISIEVINWDCVFTSSEACIASRNAWQARLLSFHASSVSIHDAQASQVVRPTF